ERLVHAAYGTEFAAHGATVLVLGRATFADGARRFRIDGVLPLLFPIEGSARVGHGVVQIPRVGHFFGDVRRVRRDARGDDALFHVLHIGQREVLRGSDIA